MFYILEPEVAGHFGKAAIVDTSVRPPVVTTFHYELDGWLGDDLLETISCFIVTDRMRSAIERIARVGYEFGFVQATTSEQFRELYPDRQIPKFWWLKVTGKAGKDDIGLSTDNRLVVRAEVLEQMKEDCQLENCDIIMYS
jgi:hypothetical protein